MHSFVSCLLHVVFSTKERRPLITPTFRSDSGAILVALLARIQDERRQKVGGVEDHIHILISLPATLKIATAVQLLKGNSSKWVHEEFPDRQSFQWQVGYGAFSIGVSGVDDTIAYIVNQAEHHKRMSFKEELQIILKKHGIEYEEWMLD